MNEQEFLRDVKYHAITVIRDEGLYRHIRFRRPGTICMGFDLVTWPGVLCYTGDMGTYVFSRLSDMFEFFRTDEDRAKDGGLKINLGYWSEKLIAVDGWRRNGSATEFSLPRFEKIIREEYLQNWLDGYDLTEDQCEELQQEVEGQILDFVDDHDERYNYRLACEFSETIGGHTFQFQDLLEYSFTDYTRSFRWCCYALAWGIQKYDVEKARQGEAVTA